VIEDERRYRICQNVKNVVNPLKLKGRYIYIIQKHTIKDMPKCDICNKYFTTKKQMKQHRTKEHTKKISGTQFRIPK
jgi:hypothetical protein